MTNFISKLWHDDRYFVPRFIRDFVYNRVGLWTASYVEEDGREYYRLDYVHVPRRELPAEAVHLSGGGNQEFFHMLIPHGVYVPHVLLADGSVCELPPIEAGQYPKPLHLTATDLYLWLVNHDISDALTNQGKSRIIMDTKTLGVVGIGIIAAIVAAWLLMG